VSNSDLLDYETSRRHRLIVIATNNNYNNDDDNNNYYYDYATVWVNVVDINDNVPQFYQDRYQSAVWENNPANTFVLQVCLYTKVVHQAHIDNLVNSQRIFIIPSLAHSLEDLR